MTPPLACFPFLMTLAALGVLIVLALVAAVLVWRIEPKYWVRKLQKDATCAAAPIISSP